MRDYFYALGFQAGRNAGFRRVGSPGARHDCPLAPEFAAADDDTQL